MILMRNTGLQITTRIQYANQHELKQMMTILINVLIVHSSPLPPSPKKIYFSLVN